MESQKTIHHKSAEALIELIYQRAKNVFETHQLYCAESVFYVLNQGLSGGLSPELTIRLSSGFAQGVGHAGCVCGGLSGAVMALGLFLGRKSLNGPGSKQILDRSRVLHDQFRSKFGSTCCRVLLKKDILDQKNKFGQCAIKTGEAAKIAAAIILEARPGLVEEADWHFLSTRDSKIGAGFNKLLNLVKTDTGEPG